MIRRWSYINKLNYNLNYKKRRNLKLAKSDVLVNMFMYLHVEFSLFTNAERKNWSRRKHSNQLFFLTNIMNKWAKEYRFYRNYNRMLTYQWLFKNTYIAVNLVIQKLPESYCSPYETAVPSSSITKTIVRYFSKRLGETRLDFLLSNQANSWSLASYRRPYLLNNSLSMNYKYAPFTPIFYLSSKSLLVLEQQIKHSSDFSLLLKVVNLLYLFHLKTFYSSLVKLTVLTLFDDKSKPLIFCFYVKYK